MKKVVAIIVSVLFVLSVVGLCFAAEEMKPVAPAKAEEKKAAPMEKKEAAPMMKEEKKMEKKAPAKVKHVTGEVAAVDAAAKTLTVKGKKGDVALSADGKAAAKLANVKVGDKVTVKYKEMDGKNVAMNISIAAAKKAEKKMEKKEAAPAAPMSAPVKEEKKEMKPAEKK